MKQRPRYESPADRYNENAAKEKIEVWANCRLEKLSSVDYLDWKAYRNAKLVAVIEFKKRSNPRLQYPTYMVSAEKWKNGIAMAEKLKVPFIFVVQWTDGLYHLKVTEDIEVSKGVGGRTDRGDSYDIEQMVYVDTSLFTLIK